MKRIEALEKRFAPSSDDCQPNGPGTRRQCIPAIDRHGNLSRCLCGAEMRRVPPEGMLHWMLTGEPGPWGRQFPRAWRLNVALQQSWVETLARPADAPGLPAVPGAAAEPGPSLDREGLRALPAPPVEAAAPALDLSHLPPPVAPGRVGVGEPKAPGLGDALDRLSPWR